MASAGTAVGDQIRHAKRDRARFAGTRAGKNQHRAFRGFGGAALFWIELIEKIQHGSVGVKNSCSVMLADADESRKQAQFSLINDERNAKATRARQLNVAAGL